jgi:hypothetical protein
MPRFAQRISLNPLGPRVHWPWHLHRPSPSWCPYFSPCPASVHPQLPCLSTFTVCVWQDPNCTRAQLCLLHAWKHCAWGEDTTPLIRLTVSSWSPTSCSPSCSLAMPSYRLLPRWLVTSVSTQCIILLIIFLVWIIKGNFHLPCAPTTPIP